MAYEIKLKVQKNIKVKGERVGDYFYDKDTDTIFYELPYLFPCKFAVRSLDEIVVTPLMLRLPSFLKYHNIDWLRQQLLQVKCVLNGSLLLHAAAWKKNGIGYMAAGFANSGKSTMVLEEVADGAEFCADENVILTKNKQVIPVKRSTSLSPKLAKDISYPLTLAQRLRYIFTITRSKLLPIFEPNIWVDLPYKRYEFFIDKIYLLTKGKGQSLALLTDNEFPFYTNPVIQTYAYASGWQLDEVYKLYRKLLKEAEKCL